jgi:hypothetical protein
VKNLVLLYQAGMKTIIGQKFGREIRRPLFFDILSKEGTSVSYQLELIPFVSGSVFIEGAYMYHDMTNPSVVESYVKAITPMKTKTESEMTLQ